jgi:protein-S-isoprenylcysteine O-methyltransferase Ste14
MQALETKVPPPIVAAIVALAMWGLARATGLLEADSRLLKALTVVFVVVGPCFAVPALFAFRQAKTTPNPRKPGDASALVESGVFKYTRNPMYVGLTSILIGWTCYLASPWALIGPFVFVLYIDRFQIAPEERVLRDKFGESYAAYEKRVRRWL